MKQKLWLTLVDCIAYCIDKELYKAIDYLREQVRVLVEHQEKQNKRIILTNSQRMRVAAKAKRLSRKMLEQCTELFTPDTVISWYNKLIAEKYDGSANRGKVGRPKITAEIVKLVIKFKKENPRWGYQKITDQIEYLGFKISKTSVKNIFIENGYDLKSEDQTLLNIQFGQINTYDNIYNDDFYTIELRQNPFSRWKLIPSYGYSWSPNGAKYLYSDVKYHINIKPSLYLLISTGIGLYDNHGDLKLGHTIEFRSGLELIYVMKNKHSIGLSTYHFSNSRLGSRNPGTESLSLSYSIPIKVFSES